MPEEWKALKWRLGRLVSWQDVYKAKLEHEPQSSDWGSVCFDESVQANRR